MNYFGTGPAIGRSTPTFDDANGGPTMIALILTLMLTALTLQIFCFTRLNRTETQPVPVKAPKPKAEDEKKTKLGRPIRIVQINS